MLRLPLLTVLFVVIVASAATGAELDDDAELHRIDELLAAGQAEAALARARSLLTSPDLEPRNQWRARQRLATALVATGRPAEAVPLLEAVVAEVKGEPSPRLNLARALVAVGQAGRAVAEYQRALELDPGRAEWRLEYAGTLVNMRAYHAAGQQIAEARRLCGDCPPALRAEANLRLAAGDAAGAVAPLRALRSHGAGVDVRGLLVAALWNTGDVEGVAAELDSVPGTDLSPDEMLVLVQLERARGRAVRVLQWLAEPTRDRPAAWEPPARFWALASEACLAANEAAAALAAIDLALERRPDVAVYHHNRAAVLIALGRQDEARKALDEARRLDPDLGGQH